MSHLEKIPVKVFWETLEQRLAACSTEELRAILRAMAQETPSAERAAFLAKLKPVEPVLLTGQQTIQQEDLLADIDDLLQQIKIAMKNADDWEERYNNEWGEYDDEDSLGPYEEFIEPLTNLFDRIEVAFDYGNLPLARTAYQKLFTVLNLEDDYGRGIHSSDLTSVDLGEARARYLRAVYELEPLDRRPRTLFAQMQQVRSELPKPRLMLADLLQISPRPLPDREKFLPEWITFLRTQNGNEADAWLREAIWLSQGTPGLAALAQAEGTTRPRAYLDWFTALAQEGNDRAVLVAAQAALQTLPAHLPIRAAVADHLITAAGRLNETEVVRAGRWEAFLVLPSLPRLHDLWDTMPVAEERTDLMQQALDHIRTYLAHPPSRPGNILLGGDALERPVWIGKSELAHACLLAEDFAAAHHLAAGEQVLGWSSSDNRQGLVLSFFLVLLSGKGAAVLPPNLAQLWTDTLQSSVGFWSAGGTGGEQLRQRLERVYADVFTRVSLPEEWSEEILAWGLEVIRRRVNAIVSGQHRGSYDKAALLTAAGAETLWLRHPGQPAARALVEEISNRFPRHRAFQTELKTAVQRMERSLR